MKTRVIHVNDMDRYPDAIYIGRANRWKGLRASKWANPCTIGKDGTRAEVIEKYRWLMSTVSPDGVMNLDAYREIAGKPLACWCRHDGEERTEANACHGDVLITLIQELGLEPQS